MEIMTPQLWLFMIIRERKLFHPGANILVIFPVISSMVIRQWLELWISELKAIWKGGEMAMAALPVSLGQKAMFSLPNPCLS